MRAAASYMCGFTVNFDLRIYLTDFLNREIVGENVKMRAFCGGKIWKSAPVYRSGVNHGAAPYFTRRALEPMEKPLIMTLLPAAL